MLHDLLRVTVLTCTLCRGASWVLLLSVFDSTVHDLQILIYKLMISLARHFLS